MTSVTFYCKIGFLIKPNMSASGRRSVEKRVKGVRSYSNT